MSEQLLLQSLTNLGEDPNASLYLTEVIQKDPIYFINFASTVINNSDSPKIVLNCVTIIGRILKPSLQSAYSIGQLYQNMNNEQKNCLKQAVLRALMFEESSTRNGGAYCMSRIVTLETKPEERTNLFIYFGELVNSQEYGIYAPIGAITAMRNILETKDFVIPLRYMKKITEIVFESCIKLMSADIPPEFKIEAPKCLKYAISIFRTNIRNYDQKLFQLLIYNIQVDNNEFHAAVISSLTELMIVSYTYLTPEILISIFQCTFPDIQGENKSRMINIIEMWRKFSKSEIDYIENNKFENYTSMVASALDEFLFEKLGADDYSSFEDNSQWYQSKAAFNCLEAFSKVASEKVLNDAFDFYSTIKNAQQVTPEAKFASICAAQIITEIRSESSVAFINDNFQEFIFLTKAPDNGIQAAAYALLIAIVEQYRSLCNQIEVLAKILEVVDYGLSSKDLGLFKRALLLFDELMKFYSYEDLDSIMGDQFQPIMGMFQKAISREDIMKNSLYAGILYDSIANFLKIQPKSNQRILPSLLSTYIHQFEQTLQNPEQSDIIRFCLSKVINSIIFVLRTEIAPYSNIMIPLFINACHIGTDEYNEELLITLSSAIEYMSYEEVEPYINDIYQIIITSFETHNDNIIISNCVLIDTFINVCKTNININIVLDLLSRLYKTIIGSLKEYLISQILHSISVILELPLENQIDEQRNDLFQLFINIMTMLPSYAKSDIESCLYIYDNLLLCFKNIAILYDYEKTTDPSKNIVIPSPFLQQYQKNYIELIQIGNNEKLFSVRIYNAFLDYLDTVIKSFGTFNRMNVYIHKPCFTAYLNNINFDRNLPMRLIEKFREVKRRFDSA